MFVKIHLSDINVAQLNSSSIILITQFLNKCRGYEDFDLHLQQPGIVKKIVDYAEQSNDPDLIVLSMKIKRSITSHISKTDRKLAEARKEEELDDDK